MFGNKLINILPGAVYLMIWVKEILNFNSKDSVAMTTLEELQIISFKLKADVSNILSSS